MCECCGGDCKLCGKEMEEKDIFKAYKEMSDKFDEFTQAMRARHTNLGCDAPGTDITGRFIKVPEFIPIPDLETIIRPEPPKNFPKSFLEEVFFCEESLESCLEDGWSHIQPSNRPDESFRAMVKIISKWKMYLEARDKKEEADKKIIDGMKARGVDVDAKMSEAILNRLQDIGRAQQKLKSILDEDLLEQHSKHYPYWHTDDLEVANDRLHDLRCKLNCLSDNLWDLWTILRKEEEL